MIGKQGVGFLPDNLGRIRIQRVFLYPISFQNPPVNLSFTSPNPFQSLVPGGVQEEPVVAMLREKFKWRTHKDESTEAEHRGGPTRSSAEVSVMEMERRGWIILPYCCVNQQWEEPGGKARSLGTATG